MLCSFAGTNIFPAPDPTRAGHADPVPTVTVCNSTPTPAQVAAHLRQVTGLNPAQIERVLAAACLGIKDNLAKAVAALAANDHAVLGRSAHTLKGTLLQCGLDDLAQTAEEIHLAVRKGSDVDYVALLQVLDERLASLTAVEPQ
jgi:HPt (histidine-containing phosphotransfer) domain-containing protein